MKTTEINQLSSNKNVINDDINKEKGILIEVKLIMLFEFTKSKPNVNITLNDLIKNINLKFHLEEHEYELYIDNNFIYNLPPNTLLIDLFNKYQSNNVKIKTFKNIFDVLKEMNNYEQFLINKIQLKEKEIDSLNKEYKSIIEELQNL